jgi:hypothetical protein
MAVIRCKREVHERPLTRDTLYCPQPAIRGRLLPPLSWFRNLAIADFQFCRTASEKSGWLFKTHSRPSTFSPASSKPAGRRRRSNGSNVASISAIQVPANGQVQPFEFHAHSSHCHHIPRTWKALRVVACNACDSLPRLRCRQLHQAWPVVG